MTHEVTPDAAAVVRRVARSWRAALWLGAELALALALVQLPLFGVLGFEHAVAVALLGALVALDVGVTIGGHGAPPPRAVVGRAAAAAGVAAAVTAVPGVIAALNGVRVPTCDWGFGIRAYLSLVTTGAVVFALAGVAIGIGARRAWARLALGVAVVLGLAVAAIWRFYREPAVFSYSPLVGYFPGNLYDEHVRLGAALYWARLEQLAWAIGAVAAVVAARGRRPVAARAPALLVAAVAAVIGLALHLASGRLGYAVDAEDVQAELGGRLETEHFVIYHARTPAILADLELIADDHELRLAQVVAALGLDEAELRRMGKIRSYLFATRDQKARLMGARDVEMAKPWRREIYLTHGGFPDGSLRHEIAHVVAGRFGDPLFGVSARRVLGVPLLVNPGLVEGLAVAVDWPGGHGRALTPHQAVRAMQVMGVQPSVRDVFSLGFLSLSSARGYTTAGSFVRFLLDAHGPEPLRRVYRSGGDFRGVYGRSLRELEADWRAMLEGVPLGDDEIEIVRERFRHGGVFSRRCPHAVAARFDEAVAAGARGDRAGAITALRRVCRDSGGEPRYRLALADYLAGGAGGEHAEAIAIYEEVAGDAERMTSSLRASALERLGHVAARAGDWAAAAARLAEAAAMPLEDGPARQLEAKLAALRHPGPAAPALRAYFFGDAAAPEAAAPETDAALAWTERAVELEPGLGLAWYLRGLQRAARGDPSGAAADLGRGLDLGLPSRRFERNAARQLALAAWRAGDRAAVARAIAVLDAPGRTEVDAGLARDWRDRLAWSASRRLPE